MIASVTGNAILGAAATLGFTAYYLWARRAHRHDWTELERRMADHQKGHNP